MRRETSRLAAGLAVACAIACVPPSTLRAQRLEPGLDALRYAQPPPEVWGAVRRLLADRGYPLAGADAEAVGQHTAPLAALLSPARETHPYREDTGLLQQLGIGGAPTMPAEGSVSLDTDWSRKRGDRYHADGLVLPDGFRVIFTRVQFDPSNYKETRTRDLELELELARRLAPAAAERLERAADGAAPR